MYIKPKIIAEIGCNHKGDMEIAFELIKLAKECGADVAKFQKRNSKELLTEEQYNSPHPNPYNSYGETYGAHREFLEFDIDQNIKLMDYCNKIGIEYSTSVWDVTSARDIVSMNPDMIKVPSACNNHFDMLQILRDDYSGDVHISLGMTSSEEVDQIIDFFDHKNILKDRVIIYACTSGYPVPFDQLCLLEIKKLIDFADLSYLTATITAMGALIYNDTNSDKAVCVLDFTSNKTSTAGTFTIQFPTADASNAIIRIA